MSTLLLAICFWLCLGGVAYVYFIYPLVIWCLSRCFGRRQEAAMLADEELPSLSVLIAAYNEEAVIEDRVKNVLGLDYPSEKLELVIACDGCSDSTAVTARRYARRGVRVLEYGTRRGKSATLNAAFAELKGDIVMLSDANTNTDRDAARNLVRWFRDPTVGAVCGRLIMTDPETGRNVDSLYWRYETFIKRCEGRLGALLGANGAIYAIRRELYQPIPTNTIVDDFVIPLLARLRTGCAIIFDPQAIAREETAADVRSEFRRRSRIGAGGFQSIAMLGKLMNPRRGWVSFTFFSHKVLRWVCPFFLVALLASNLLLLRQPFYQLCLLGQLLFYALALVGAWVPGRISALKIVRLTTLFASMNLALLVGFGRWLFGTQRAAWARTSRLAEVGQANGQTKEFT
jgi:cellulose synthase/poly-beta-1,6-N-acetylglucosamine synthase-like glycosyltransferase